MPTLVTSSIQKRIAIGVMAAALLFGMVAPSAQAQSSDSDLRAQIAQLLALVQQLQSELDANDASTVNQNSSEMSTADSVLTTARLRVRTSYMAGAEIISVVPQGAIGVLRQGPVKRGNHDWWWVSYRNGTSGWSAGTWLQKVYVEEETEDTPVDADPVVVEEETEDTPVDADPVVVDDTPSVSVSGINLDTMEVRGEAENTSEIILVIRDEAEKIAYRNLSVPVDSGNTWEHVITKTLEPGTYTANVKTDLKVLDKLTFEMGGGSPLVQGVSISQPEMQLIEALDTLKQVLVKM